MGADSPPLLYLDASIAPRRSLDRRGVMLIMVPVAVINVAFAAFFILIGGAFVPPFLGLDVIGLAIAFWLSFRSTRRVERIRISADEIRISRADDAAEEVLWVSAPAFTRVNLDAPGRHASRLRLHCKGRTLTIAASVSPQERRRIAERVEQALTAARSERW